jgi:hypothetical protein
MPGRYRHNITSNNHKYHRLTLHYGIFIKNDYWYNREIIIHELVHTAQYERLSGIQNFLNQYLTECINFGYPAARKSR